MLISITLLHWLQATEGGNLSSLLCNNNKEQVGSYFISIVSSKKSSPLSLCTAAAKRRLLLLLSILAPYLQWWWTRPIYRPLFVWLVGQCMGLIYEQWIWSTSILIVFFNYFNLFYSLIWLNWASRISLCTKASTTLLNLTTLSCLLFLYQNANVTFYLYILMMTLACELKRSKSWLYQNVWKLHCQMLELLFQQIFQLVSSSMLKIKLCELK